MHGFVFSAQCKPNARLEIYGALGAWGGGVGESARGHPPPPRPPLFGGKLIKNYDYHFTVENTELMIQHNSLFDFTKYVG